MSRTSNARDDPAASGTSCLRPLTRAGCARYFPSRPRVDGARLKVIPTEGYRRVCGVSDQTRPLASANRVTRSNEGSPGAIRRGPCQQRHSVASDSAATEWGWGSSVGSAITPYSAAGNCPARRRKERSRSPSIRIPPNYYFAKHHCRITNAISKYITKQVRNITILHPAEIDWIQQGVHDPQPSRIARWLNVYYRNEVFLWFLPPSDRRGCLAEVSVQRETRWRPGRTTNHFVGTISSTAEPALVLAQKRRSREHSTSPFRLGVTNGKEIVAQARSQPEHTQPNVHPTARWG